MDNATKAKVMGQLQLKVKPAEIAESLDVSYGAVLTFSRKYEQAKLDGTVSKLIDVDEAVVTAVGEAIGVDASNVVNGAKGLAKLNSELQMSALYINTRVRSLIMSTESPSELETYSDIVCNLQKAFFATGTTVNVQNNIGGDSVKYGQFLGDVPNG